MSIWNELTCPDCTAQKRCDPCTAEARRNTDRLRRTKPERLAYGRKWREENAEKHRSYRLKSQFGITLDDYNEVLAFQDGLCAICQTDPHRSRNAPVDHSHVTGLVRGVLCSQCNARLGWFEKNRDRILSYLIDPPFAQITTTKGKK